MIGDEFHYIRQRGEPRMRMRWLLPFFFALLLILPMAVSDKSAAASISGGTGTDLPIAAHEQNDVTLLPTAGLTNPGAGTYAFKVNRQLEPVSIVENPSLTGLIVGTEDLTSRLNAFDPHFEFDVDVPYGQESIDITAYSMLQSTITLHLGTETMEPGIPYHLSLTSGSNTFVITTTSNDGNLHVSYTIRVHRAAPSAVDHLSVTASPETARVYNETEWSLSFTPTEPLTHEDKIYLALTPGFTFNFKENNRIYWSGLPAVTVNDIPASAVILTTNTSNEDVLEIWLGEMPASSTANVVLKQGALRNPPTMGSVQFQVTTSKDTTPAVAYGTIAPSSLNVAASNLTASAQNVAYRLTYTARSEISEHNRIYLKVPFHISNEAAETVRLNDTALQHIGSDGNGVYYLTPAKDQIIAADSPVSLEFSPAAGIANSWQSAEPLLIGVSTDDQKQVLDYFPVIYEMDETKPTGGFTVNGGAAKTFSRRVTLDLSATDGTGSGVSGVIVSEDPEFEHTANYPYVPQIDYLLRGSDPVHTLYLKFSDWAGNESDPYTATIQYSSELNLSSLAVDGGYAVFPEVSDEAQHYYIQVPNDVSTLSLTPETNDPDAVLSVSPDVLDANGRITLPSLRPGSNEITITVSKGADHNVYGLTVFRESSPLIGINNGDIVSLGSKEWIVVDKDRRELLLKEVDTGCPDSTDNDGTCHWGVSGSSWYFEGAEADGYVFRPEQPGSIAHYLNHMFWGELGADQSLVQRHPFDQTLYLLNYEAPLADMTRSSFESKVVANVGLLGVDRYEALKAELSAYESEFTYFLMNPIRAESENAHFILAVDSLGHVRYSDAPSAVRPVVYLKPSVSKTTGSGVAGDPYLLAEVAGNADIAKVRVGENDFEYDASTTPPAWSAEVEAESVMLSVIMSDSSSSFRVHDTSPAALSYTVNDNTITIDPLPKGVSTLHLTTTATDGTTRHYDVRIARPALSALDMVLEAKAALDENEIKSDNLSLASVTQNVHLPVIGLHGTTIEWQSDQTAVVDVDGTVHRPPFYGTNANVTLTATIRKGNAWQTKTFELTVLKAEPATADHEAAVAAAKAALTWESIRGWNSAPDRVVSNLALPTKGARGTMITWSSSASSVISPNGTVTRAAYGSGDITVTLTAKLTRGNASALQPFILTVLEEEPETDADAIAVNAAYHALTWLELRQANTDIDSVTSSVYLPSAGVQGTTIQWSSSQPSVIALDGTVVRPSYSQGDALVTLRAVISRGGAYSEKLFVVKVLKLEPTGAEDQTAVERAKVELTEFIHTSYNLGGITTNMQLPATGAQGSSISWISSHTAVVGNDGTVNRPAYSAGDATVTLTATISRGGASVQQLFTVTVVKRAPYPMGEPVTADTNRPMVFNGGIILNLAGASVGSGATVLVTAGATDDMRPGMQVAGSVAHISLSNVTLAPGSTVALTLPVNAAADLSKVGVFDYNESTKQWEALPTSIDPDTRQVTVHISHFSTYGVFEADTAAAPIVSFNEQSQLVLPSVSGISYYYSLDGTEPGRESLLYNPAAKPTIGHTTPVHVVAVESGKRNSSVRAAATLEYVIGQAKSLSDWNKDGKVDSSDMKALLKLIPARRESSE